VIWCRMLADGVAGPRVRRVNRGWPRLNAKKVNRMAKYGEIQTRGERGRQEGRDVIQRA